MFQLNNLKPKRGAKKRRKRLGRGPGSGSGTYASRGLNGQKSRSGGSPHGWFEGGQMPLYRRVPKRGFFSRNRIVNQIVNLADFDRFDASREVDLEYLRELGIVQGLDPRVKILGHGDLKGSFRVKVHAVSDSARQKIEQQGGTIEILPYGRAKSDAPKAAGSKAAAPKAEAPKAAAPKAATPKAKAPKAEKAPDTPDTDAGTEEEEQGT